MKQLFWVAIDYFCNTRIIMLFFLNIFIIVVLLADCRIYLLYTFIVEILLYIRLKLLPLRGFNIYGSLPLDRSKLISSSALIWEVPTQRLKKTSYFFRFKRYMFSITEILSKAEALAKKNLCDQMQFEKNQMLFEKNLSAIDAGALVVPEAIDAGALVVPEAIHAGALALTKPIGPELMGVCLDIIKDSQQLPDAPVCSSLEEFTKLISTVSPEIQQLIFHKITVASLILTVGDVSDVLVQPESINFLKDISSLNLETSRNMQKYNTTIMSRISHLHDIHFDSLHLKLQSNFYSLLKEQDPVAILQEVHNQPPIGRTKMLAGAAIGCTAAIGSAALAFSLSYSSPAVVQIVTAELVKHSDLIDISLIFPS